MFSIIFILFLNFLELLEVVSRDLQDLIIEYIQVLRRPFQKRFSVSGKKHKLYNRPFLYGCHKNHWFNNDTKKQINRHGLRF